MRPSPRRYAIYTRQSTSAGAEVLSSCQVQFEMCFEYMRSFGSSVVWIGERLDDIACTGAEMKRPAVRCPMELVKQRQIDQVVIYRLDRLTRSLLDAVVLLKNSSNTRSSSSSSPRWRSAWRPRTD